MNDVSALIQAAAAAQASDIHLVCGLPPKYRVNGELCNICEEVLTHAQCESYARQLASERYDEIAEIGELDMAASYDEVRVRINLFRQQGHVSSAIRLLSDRIPDVNTLGLPDAALKLPALHSGIVLVTGETGSGKSTTLAAMLDSVNHSRSDHIITLEDPIEYIYTPDKCVINQREIGKDTQSYADGLRAILREDPDVILIGEMRDLNTIETALTAAETGHLVFSTLHTNSAADSMDRIINVFPQGQQKQIAMQLSMTLKAVISQQLVKRTGGGRILACEFMIVNDAIRNLIREGKTPQINNALSTSAQEGGITMDNMLIGLYKAKKIDAQTAQNAARDAEYVKKNTRF